MDRPRVDPATATEYEIVAAAIAMHGRTLGDLADLHWTATKPGRETKGAAGAIVEAYFGIKQNSDQEPDFRAAGIELKVAPLVVESGSPRRIKERTSVSMIDFMALDGETWNAATVRKKLRRILFVFYEWRAGIPHAEMRIATTRLWSPPQELMPILEQDWMAVWNKNHEGRAHEISEGDGRVMGACTKGASGAMRRQPHSTVLAKSRAWSLKPRLTWAIYSSRADESVEVAAVRRLAADVPADPVEALLSRLEGFVGMRVDELARRGHVDPGESKNRVASVIRVALGLKPKKLPSALEAIGLELKSIPLGPDAYPWEAMSFPAFNPVELVDEEWEDSDLAGRLQNMLMVPTYRENRDDDLLEQRLCRPFRWSPSREETAGIRLEWERFRDVIAAGHIYERPAQSQTSYIHVRPHGRNATDTVPTPGGRITVKVSFWLNQRFVQELVRSHHADWKGF